MIPRITAAVSAISIVVILDVGSKKFEFFVYVVLGVAHCFVFEAGFFGVVTLVKALESLVFGVFELQIRVGEFICKLNAVKVKKLWLFGLGV